MIDVINNDERLKISIRGAVQGVGFRPFVFRLATEMKLYGWVSNSAQGVFIEVEGQKEILNRFLIRLQKEIPPRAFIQSLEFSFLDLVGFSSFEIRESNSIGTKTTLVLPDIATCPDCLKEILDPSNSRYLYPFTNCTNCGPRFSIIEALPYDRSNTSMNKFEMCSACQAEYENPLDRRFHAQPNACPVCGPQIVLWNAKGTKLAEKNDALLQTVEEIRAGKIAAVKSIGGFHLMVDARNNEAVHRLRERKHREEKPFALMFPSLSEVKEECEVSELEERLLTSPEAPIVLLKRKQSTINNRQSQIPNSVAPNNPYLGIMLPYTPLHHILMKELGFPIVATSGNLSDEPICTDENEALDRLNGIADVFLIHNRPIVRNVDDSILRVMMNRELVLRRARGYAPLPIFVRTRHAESLLAVGAHLKNTIALTLGNNVFISQHIGDLETKESLDAFHKVVKDFQILYETKPTQIVCDLHPDYLSSKFSRNSDIKLNEIQHHYAHIASCMAENQIEGETLGVAWDGTGYGTDGTIWGGEFLLTTASDFEHVAALRPFRLPGGEKAIKEPRRTALGLLYELYGQKVFNRTDLSTLKAFSQSEIEMFRQILTKKINSPITSSAGRLFDAVASLIGLRQIVHFEGQAAMELEFLTAQSKTQETYIFSVDDYSLTIEEVEKQSVVSRQLSVVHDPLIAEGEQLLRNNLQQTTNNDKSEIENQKSEFFIDWSQIIFGVIEDVNSQVSPSIISSKFHNTLSEIIIKVAKQVGQKRVVLSGGCFQNKYLTEQTVKRLQQEGFHPYWHQRVPPNDGGIALGQAYAVIRNKH